MQSSNPFGIVEYPWKFKVNIDTSNHGTKQKIVVAYHPKHAA
jgi:hypothetical protein